MSIVRIVGDVHGKWDRYRTLTRGIDLSLQVGDFGFRKDHLNHLKYRDSKRHKICFGNHDDYYYVNHPHSIGHFGMWENMFCIRGGFSIDQIHRTIGISWWPEEEMEYGQMMACANEYERILPDIVISHDCPVFLYPFMGYLPEKMSRTPRFLSHIWEIHAPKLWIYGHHHRSSTKQWGDTKFICLEELEYLDLDTETLDITRPDS